MTKTIRDDFVYRLVSGRRGARQIFRFLRDHDCCVLREIDGIKLVCHADKIGRALADGVLWQRQEFLTALDLVQKEGRFKPGGVFVDVGANIGMHSIYAARAEKFSRVIAVEPLSENFDLMETNLRLNGIACVAAIHEAAGAKKADAPLYRNVRNYGKSNLSNDMGDGFETVRVRPLASILKSQSVSPGSVSLVWIDVEGFEPEVVAGMTDLIGRRTPLVIEFTPDYLGERKRELVEELEAHYGQCHVLSPNATTPMPINGLLSLQEQVDIVVV